MVAVQLQQVIILELRLTVLVAVQDIDISQALFILNPFALKVPVKAPIVIDCTFAVLAVTVTVPPPEEPSNITASELVGTLAQPTPPEEVDQ